MKYFENKDVRLNLGLIMERYYQSMSRRERKNAAVTVKDPAITRNNVIKAPFPKYWLECLKATEIQIGINIIGKPTELNHISCRFHCLLCGAEHTAPWDEAFCKKEGDLKMTFTVYEYNCVERNSVYDQFFMYLYNVLTNWWLASHFGKGVALDDDFKFVLLQKEGLKVPICDELHDKNTNLLEYIKGDLNHFDEADATEIKENFLFILKHQIRYGIELIWTFISNRRQKIQSKVNHFVEVQALEALHSGKNRYNSNFNYNEDILADHAAAPVNPNIKFWEVDTFVTNVVKDQNQIEWEDFAFQSKMLAIEYVEPTNRGSKMLHLASCDVMVSHWLVYSLNEFDRDILKILDPEF